MSQLFRTTILIGCLLGCVVTVYAQQLPIKIYTTSEGLARNRVTRIRMDSRNFLWFCTEEGLSRFDGYQFKNYSADDGLPSSNIWDFLETRDGNFWVATLNGLARYSPSGFQPSQKQRKPDRENQFFVTYPREDNRNPSVRSLFEDSQGTIWCGTWSGLFYLQYENDDWHLRPTEIKNYIYNIIEDRKGVLWFATSAGLFRKFADGRMEKFTVKNGLIDNNIRGLLEARDGSIWVGTGNGVCQLRKDIDPTQNIVQRILDVKKGITGECNWFFQPADNRLFICSGDGLFEIIETPDKRDYLVKPFSKVLGIGDNYIWAMVEDRDGNQWIATNTDGAIKISRNGFATWRKDDGIGTDFVVGLSENRAGNICVASYAASGRLISEFDGEKFKTVRPFSPKAITDFGLEAQQNNFQDHTGEWWIPTDSGLLRYPKVASLEKLATTPPKALYTVKDGLASNRVRKLYQDSRGDIWIGVVIPSNKAYLTRWERKTERFFHYTETDGLINDTITGIREDKSGNIWVVSARGSAARYKDGRFRRFDLVPQTPGRRLHEIYCDSKGRLWVGTAENGLICIDRPDDEQPQITFLTVKDGLSSNDIWDITEDNLGHLYLGTGRGVDRLDPQTKQVKHYSTDDGLTTNYVLMIHRDRHGAIWAGTQKGVSRLIPEPDPPLQPPPIFISRILIDGEKYSITELGDTQIEIAELSPSQNKLNIDFFGLSLAVGETLRYQYKLEGAGGDWSEPSTQRNVNFANLRSGSYRFLVRAVGTDGKVSAEPASVTFRILAPIWLRWWFITLSILLISSTVAVFIRFRLLRKREREQSEAALRQAKEERLRELEQVRRRIATDLHDDIGSNLTRISLLSEVAQRRVDGQEAPVGHQLSNIAKLSRELVDSMSEIVWAINPSKDHLSDLNQKMRHFASDVLTARQIDFIFRAPNLETDIKVGANVRREIFLLFKEGINNIVRHAKCTEVEIDFRADGENLELSLRDNGQGFAVDEKYQGHGLASMGERTRALGGELTINSVSDSGTTVKFVIPYRAHESNGHLS
ncbi:MAG: two-component regulator propeller domain-containing protein [Acidobacteriota bacterium]